MESFEIELLGRKYYFKTDEPDKIKAYSDFIKEELNILAERYPSIDNQKLFVFFMLTLTERYFKEVDKNKHLSEEIKNIDSSLNIVTSDINI